MNHRCHGEGRGWTGGNGGMWVEAANTALSELLNTPGGLVNVQAVPSEITSPSPHNSTLIRPQTDCGCSGINDCPVWTRIRWRGWIHRTFYVFCFCNYVNFPTVGSLKVLLLIIILPLPLHLSSAVLNTPLVPPHNLALLMSLMCMSLHYKPMMGTWKKKNLGIHRGIVYILDRKIWATI